MSNESLTPPKATAADHAHTLGRAGISSIPIVGGPAVELFQMLITPSLEKRKLEWMESVAEGLQRLEEKHGNIIDDLKSNDAFIDTVMLASHAAVRTSQQEKKQALRNAVLNAALPQPPDESRQLLFISWVESFTPWHLRMLKLFANPLDWYQENGRQPPQYHFAGSLSAMLVDAYPELKDERALFDKVCKDLHNDGLIGVEHLYINMGSGVYDMRAEPLGNEFLRFISDPLQ